MASKYKIHPAANIFPMLSDADFAALKADIEANGQVEEIAFFENQVIDGRNRLRACEELGIEPFGFELTECKDPVAYVLSKNLHRRHLTPSQAGICAARARDYYDQQAKERQKRKSQSVVETLPPQNHEKARDAAGKAADQNQALARRKELYEALHPETTREATLKQNRTDKMSERTVPSFAADTAAKTGQSEHD